jgi:hypothetical protein
MSSASFELRECKGTQAESSPAWLAEFGALTHRSMIATGMMWLGLASRRINENLSFPIKLGKCNSVRDVVSTFRSYHRAMLEQYERAVTELRHINLTLASEAPFAGLLSARSARVSSREKTAHSSVAARGSS